MDLIDRAELIKQFRRKKCYASCGLFDICSVPCSTAKIILDAPTFKMECGTWIERVDGTHYCSNCWYDTLFNGDNLECLSEYCPHCGKLMTKRMPFGEDVADNG